ncbi:MAG: signal recognition particle-docking protein FtsY [Candidatus Binatia bacterium]
MKSTESSGFFQRLRQGLARTRKGWAQKLETLFQGRSGHEEVIEGLEEILITADVGMKATHRLLEALRCRSSTDWNSSEGVSTCLQNEIVRILTEPSHVVKGPPRYSVKPWVVLFVGVNGAGKTTTIGKLAEQHRRDNKKVLLVAADTFRAGAIKQLEIWGDRVGAQVIKHQPGQDPSGVVFDAIRSAQKNQSDIVLIDTAGRLHTKLPLLEELKKMRRVLGRELSGSPHETLLVLDATTGQNALQQAKVFKEYLGVTGIVLTKLDGTAKGGVVIGIQEELKIPVEYIGVGETPEDLQPFDANRFAQALFA